MTIHNVANILNVSEETIRRWIRSGDLKASINSRKSGYFIDPENFETFCMNHKYPKYNYSANAYKLSLKEQPEYISREQMQAELKYYRTILHLSGAELGRKLGLSRQAINTLESGGYVMTKTTYLAICYIFEHMDNPYAMRILKDDVKDELEALKKFR